MRCYVRCSKESEAEATGSHYRPRRHLGAELHRAHEEIARLTELLAGRDQEIRELGRSSRFGAAPRLLRATDVANRDHGRITRRLPRHTAKPLGAFHVEEALFAQIESVGQCALLSSGHDASRRGDLMNAEGGGFGA